MGATPKDADEKVRRGYRNPKTIVWADGRERLVGYDWTKRVRELRKRSGGRCEYLIPIVPSGSVRCSRAADDAHHIAKRWPSRDDRIENLVHICRHHHRLLDSRKIRSDRAERRES